MKLRLKTPYRHMNNLYFLLSLDNYIIILRLKKFYQFIIIPIGYNLNFFKKFKIFQFYHIDKKLHFLDLFNLDKTTCFLDIIVD